MTRKIDRRTLIQTSLLGSVASLASTTEAAESASQPKSQWAQPLAQNYSTVFHNTAPKLYVEGCGLVRLNDGVLVAVVPIVPRSKWTDELRPKHSHVHLLRSEDGGSSWQPASVLPYYSGVPWTHGDALYLFGFEPGTKFRNDNLVLLRSADGGKSWSPPSTLFEGHFWNCHTGMAVRNGQLYWAIDEFAKIRYPRMIAGDLSKDPIDPKAWRMSNPVPFPKVPRELSAPRYKNPGGMYLEPNVIDFHGQLRALVTVKINGQSTANFCAVLDAEDDGQDLKLEFSQFSAMPGGQLKFCVIWDDATKLFWATSNLVVDSHSQSAWWRNAEGRMKQGGNDRRFLMLHYSLDGLNWMPAGCVAQAGKTSQSFMYGKPAINGDDLVVISRTSIAAEDQHDADYATFHRVRNFRSLALNLVPIG